MKNRISKIQTLIILLLAITDSAFAFFVQDPLKATLDTLHRFIQDIVRDTNGEYVYPDRSTWDVTSEVIDDAFEVVERLVARMRTEFIEHFNPNDFDPLAVSGVMHQYVFFFAYFAPERFSPSDLAFLVYLAEADDDYDTADNKVLLNWLSEAKRLLSYVAPIVIKQEVDNMLNELKQHIELVQARQEGYEVAMQEIAGRDGELEAGNIEAQLTAKDEDRYDFHSAWTELDLEQFDCACDCDMCNEIRDAAEEEAYDDEAWYDEMNRNYADDIENSINRFGRSRFND